MVVVDNRQEIRDFLATRRAKLSPDDAGLALYGGRPRVPGLRREEVALIAGVSPDYYARLEKGHVQGASEQVLNAIADALHLHEAERIHLHNLAQTARTSARQPPKRRPAGKVRPSVLRVLESMVGTAAFVRDAHLNVLATNVLGRALYAPLFADPTTRGNLARFNFLDPASRTFYPEWDIASDTTVALLRTAAGADPFDKGLTDLIGELATRSDAFRTRWGNHDVRLHRTGKKSFNHPVVGRLDVDFDALALPADSGLTLTAYTAEPGTEAAEKLSLLASWAATETPNRAAPAGDRAGLGHDSSEQSQR